jgi:glycosyltransferase involved in cell wall biosynthesis
MANGRVIGKNPWLIVTGDFVRTGGMDMANYSLARYLARAGYETHLVGHSAAVELLDLPGIHFHQVPKPGNSYLLGAPLLDRWGRYWSSKIASRGGRVVVNGGNCFGTDLNWVHYVHAAYRPETGNGWLRRAKTSWVHRKYLADERRCLRVANIVIANSHRTKRDLMSLVGLPDERIRVVYYGIEPGAFKLSTSEMRSAARGKLGWQQHHLKAAFIGSLSDNRKGFDILFQAWNQLCSDSAWDVDLIVVGAGAELSFWRSRAAVDTRLKDRIEFLGFRKDVPLILTAADLLVAPTRYEAYGLGVHEALCCGVPGIVNASAGVAERYPAELATLLLPDPPAISVLVDRLRSWRSQCHALNSVVLGFSKDLRGRAWEDMSAEIVSFTLASEG